MKADDKLTQFEDGGSCITVRDHIAIKSPYTVQDAIEIHHAAGNEVYTAKEISTLLSELNYQYADIMIEQSNK